MNWLYAIVYFNTRGSQIHKNNKRKTREVSNRLYHYRKNKQNKAARCKIGERYENQNRSFVGKVKKNNKIQRNIRQYIEVKQVAKIHKRN